MAAIPCGMDPRRERAAHAKDRGDIGCRPALVLAPKRRLSTTPKPKRYTAVPKPLTKMQELTQRVSLLERQVREHIELLAAYEARLDTAQRKRRRAA
jgi:hypothetical protein